MIGLIMGGFVILLGAAIMENAAFSARSQFGSCVVLVGVSILIGGVLDLTLGKP